MKTISIQDLVCAADEKVVVTVIVAFPDYCGRLVGKRLTVQHFLSISETGWHACDYLLGCDIANNPVAGLSFTSWDLGYGDFLVKPDLSSMIIAPWDNSSAIVLGDIFRTDGEVVDIAPRAILRSQLERAKSKGVEVQIASELEFFIFSEAGVSTSGLPSAASSQIQDYDLLSTEVDEPFLRCVRTKLDSAGIEIEGTKGEWAAGQAELNLKHTNPLEMADRHVIAKHATKVFARRYDREVTFMAKWHQSHAGSSCHIHSSVSYEEKHSGSADSRLLESGWIGGQVALASEAALLYAPNVNSYKRLQPNTFAPTTVSLGRDNRTSAFRLIESQGLQRVENRIPGADVNPYLAFAATIASGLYGLDGYSDEPKLVAGNAYLDEAAVKLPRCIEDAVSSFGACAAFRQAFGDRVVEHIRQLSTAENQWHASRVTNIELERYFERA